MYRESTLTGPMPRNYTNFGRLLAVHTCPHTCRGSTSPASPSEGSTSSLPCFTITSNVYPVAGGSRGRQSNHNARERNEHTKWQLKRSSVREQESLGAPAYKSTPVPTPLRPLLPRTTRLLCPPHLSPSIHTFLPLPTPSIHTPTHPEAIHTFLHSPCPMPPSLPVPHLSNRSHNLRSTVLGIIHSQHLESSKQPGRHNVSIYMVDDVCAALMA